MKHLAKTSKANDSKQSEGSDDGFALAMSVDEADAVLAKFGYNPDGTRTAEREAVLA